MVHSLGGASTSPSRALRRSGRPVGDSSRVFLLRLYGFLTGHIFKEYVELVSMTCSFLRSNGPPLTSKPNHSPWCYSSRPMPFIHRPLSVSLEPYIVSMFTRAGKSHLLSPTLVSLISTARSSSTITHYLSYHRPWLHFAETMQKPPLPIDPFDFTTFLIIQSSISDSSAALSKARCQAAGRLSLVG